jgi:DNA-binding Xre family transcriptional regulator
MLRRTRVWAFHGAMFNVSNLVPWDVSSLDDIIDPSLSKTAALWSSKPVTVRLDDLDMICTALDCTVADLMEAEPVAAAKPSGSGRRAVGESGSTEQVRPIPKPGSGGRRRSLPPN